MSNLGIKGWVGFRKEAVAGTAETGTTWFLSTESFNLIHKHDLVERKAFTGVIGSLQSLPGKYLPTGKADTELMAGTPHPFYWALGSVVTTALSGTAIQHTIGMESNGVLPSLTCEGYEITQSHRQGGVQMDSLELDCAVGEIAGLKLGWMAKSHVDSATLSSVPAYKTDPLTFVGATVTIGTTALTDVSAVNFKIDNGLEQIHALTTSNQYPAEVRRKSIPKFTGKLTFIDYPIAEYARLKAADTFKLTLYFEGAVIGASAYKRSMTLTAYACQYSDGLEPDIKGDVITTDGSFTAFYSPTDTKIMQVVAVNDVTLLIP